MKRLSTTVLFFVSIVVLAAIYRAIPYELRPEWLGAPQLALALFAGSVIKNRKWSFAVPIISLFLSDLLIQLFYITGLSTDIPGFYSGQLVNYGFIALLTVVGFFVNSQKAESVLGGILTVPTLYFILSNFAVWVGGGGFNRAKTFSGMLQCYVDGLPFYGYSLLSTAIYGVALFGGYALFKRTIGQQTVNI